MLRTTAHRSSATTADGTGNWYGNADTFADGASNPFGAGGTGTARCPRMRRIVPHAELRNAGRTTVGTTPSGALRGNFKRGSSFTLSERRPRHVDLRLLRRAGGASGGQYVTMAVYKDNGGVPDEYVTGAQYVGGGGHGASMADLA